MHWAGPEHCQEGLLLSFKARLQQSLHEFQPVLVPDCALAWETIGENREAELSTRSTQDELNFLPQFVGNRVAVLELLQKFEHVRSGRDQTRIDFCFH